MRRSASARLLAGGVLVTTAVLSTLVFSGSAWAAATTCKTLSVNTAKGTATVGGCNDTKNTKGSGTFPITGLIPPGGTVTITWKSGGTTTVKITVTVGETDKDPAGGSCPAGSTEYEAKGSVTGSTGLGKSVTGKVSGEACLLSTGKVEIEPKSVFTF